MTKSLSVLGLVLTGTLLFGCDLYFGNNGAGGSSGGGGGAGSGYNCTSNSQCASGCYCNTTTGVCTEGGFCTTDADCGPGYHCDTMRSSCEPGCTTDTQCPSGNYCASDGSCQLGCSTDSECPGEFCDTTAHACTQGSCGGTVTCTTAAPTCPSGQVPLIWNGCYTGACFVTADCSAQPTCTSINTEADCLAWAGGCSPVYDGINCTKPDGTACHNGDTGCTCQSYVYASCAAKSP